MKSRPIRRLSAALLGAALVLGTAGTASAQDYGGTSKTCAYPKYVWTISYGAGNVYHLQTYAGVSRTYSHYNSTIQHNSLTVPVRIVTYWAVSIDAPMSSGNGVTCES